MQMQIYLYVCGMKEDQIDVCKAAIEKWGADKQQKMAVEEAAEFIVAMMKTERAGGRQLDPDAIAKIIDEIADVAITNYQMQLIYGVEAVEERIRFKIERLKGRLVL